MLGYSCYPGPVRSNWCYCPRHEVTWTGLLLDRKHDGQHQARRRYELPCWADCIRASAETTLKTDSQVVVWRIGSAYNASPKVSDQVHFDARSNRRRVIVYAACSKPMWCLIYNQSYHAWESIPSKKLAGMRDGRIHVPRGDLQLLDEPPRTLASFIATFSGYKTM